MNQTPVKLGPLALLLTVVSICLTTLAILTFSTARADMRLAEKYADMVSLRYELMNEGEDFLQSAEEMAAMSIPVRSVPGTTADAQGVIRYDLEKDGMQLSIGVREEAQKITVVDYRITKEWEEDLDLGNLWPGF